MTQALDVDRLIHEFELEPVEETSNTAVYETRDGILVAVPFQGAADTGETARANAAQQRAYFHKAGEKGGIAIFFDRMSSQDRDARHVYQEMGDVLSGTALVGGSTLTRALASFFFTIVRPATPIRLFPDLQSALVWLRQVNETADRTLGSAPEA